MGGPAPNLSALIVGGNLRDGEEAQPMDRCAVLANGGCPTTAFLACGFNNLAVPQGFYFSRGQSSLERPRLPTQKLRCSFLDICDVGQVNIDQSPSSCAGDC